LKKGRKVLTIAALVFVAIMLFKVRTITVAGCETRSSDDIIALSGLEYNTSILEVNKQEVQTALSADPYIKPISVEIKYPDHVLITIEERKEAARIEKDSAYIIIDREGWVLRFETQPDAAAYPLVTGLPADTVLIGQQIGTSDVFKIGVLTRLLDALKTAEIAPVTIDISLAADIVLTLPDAMIVELGDDTALDEKIKLMKAGQGEIAGMGKTGGVLDVSSVKNAYYREN
jgi:cell division protein FtsQ